MPNSVNWNEIAPNVKHRKCPGCGQELTRFHLTALQMPIEQIAVPQLNEVNAAIDWSVRGFGHSSMNELQMLVFASPCPNCSLISNWDFGTKELQEIFDPNHPQVPFAQIAWNYAPQLLQKHLESAPEWLKPTFQSLLDILVPKTADDPTR